MPVTHRQVRQWPAGGGDARPGLAEGSPLALELGQVVSAALTANPLFFSDALPLRILPPFFNSHAGGEHYGAHVDGAIRAQRNGPAVRTDVSCTVFLSDPEEYECGC